MHAACLYKSHCRTRQLHELAGRHWPLRTLGSGMEVSLPSPVYCSAACALACALRSSILASPKMMYVSDAGLLKTSGFWMTKRICAHPHLLSLCFSSKSTKHGTQAQSAHVFALLYGDSRHARHRLDAQLCHCLPGLLLAAALLAARPRSPVVCAAGHSKCSNDGPSGPCCGGQWLQERAFQAALSAAHQEPSTQGYGARMVQTQC